MTTTLIVGLFTAAVPLGLASPTDLTCVGAAWKAAAPASLYAFSGGEFGTQIADGGDDMYDGGNMLRLRVDKVAVASAKRRGSNFRITSPAGVPPKRRSAFEIPASAESLTVVIAYDE